MSFLVSAVVITKNEEKNIIDCISGVKFCDEIIIIDDNSSDNTIKAINDLKLKKIKIYSRSLKDDFSEQRNFGLSKANGDWILFIDADERVNLPLQKELLKAMNDDKDKYKGYFIPRKDFIWKNRLKNGEAGDIKLLRLAKKNSGIWMGKVHEEWKIEGRIGKLKSPLFHYPHQSIQEFLKEINYYTDIRAKELFELGIKSNFFSVIFFPSGKFFVNYFLKLGFLDGIPGFIFAILMSFHSFLVRSKLKVLLEKNNLNEN